MKANVTIRGIADVQKTLAMIAPREAKNLIKATVYGIARQISDDARARAPKRTGTLDKAIRPRAERGDRNTVAAGVKVAKKAFYWRFLEFGDGPDKVEHAFFMKALQAARPNIDAIYLETFVRKLEARLARERKRMAK